MATDDTTAWTATHRSAGSERKQLVMQNS